MIPFDLNAAIHGAKLCTRSGLKAKFEYIDGENLYAIVYCGCLNRKKIEYDLEGNFDKTGSFTSRYDLMLADDEKGDNK